MADPTPPPARDWSAVWAKVRTPLIVLLVALAGAVAERYGLDPRVVEVLVPVLVPAPAPPAELVADAVPIDYEGLPYDGGREHGAEALHHHEGEAEALRWPTDRVTYSIDYASARRVRPPLTDDAVRAAARTAWGWWSESITVDFVEVPHGSPAMVPVSFARIDGPGGVLAKAYLANGTLSPKPMVFDVDEYWTPGPPAAGRISLPTVWCHEGGHTLGAGHDAANAPAVMRPAYTAQFPREQPRDVDRMVAELGYARRPPRPADPGLPGGTAAVVAFPVSAKLSDLVDAVRKAGGTAEPPK